MCRGQDMSVMVMDVEGTDGRERGEDQVGALQLRHRHLTKHPGRISNANRPCFRLLLQKCSSSISGSIKSVYIKAPTWGLLKTVFEVNLGLFGKNSADAYVVINPT